MMNERAILAQLMGVTDKWVLVNVQVETEVLVDRFGGGYPRLDQPPKSLAETPHMFIATLEFHGQPRRDK